MSSGRILIVEDEPDIRNMISYRLRRVGYHTVDVESGEDGLARMEKESFDLVVLDVMLPGINGLQACQRIKMDPGFANVAIIIVSARGAEDDIVKGLELGADDYVTKPFSPKVLLARIDAVLRRRSVTSDTDGPVTVGPFEIRPDLQQISVGGNEVELTQSEFRLFHALLQGQGRVLTRSQLVQALHEGRTNVTARSIDVQVVGLRRKLGRWGSWIKTVRGIGYRLMDD